MGFQPFAGSLVASTSHEPPSGLRLLVPTAIMYVLPSTSTLPAGSVFFPCAGGGGMNSGLGPPAGPLSGSPNYGRPFSLKVTGTATDG